MATDTIQEEAVDLVAQKPGYCAVGDDTSDSSTRHWMIDRHIWPQRQRVARVAVVVVGSLTAVAGLLLLSHAVTSRALRSQLRAPIEEVEWIGVPPCGLVEHGVAYEGRPEQPEQVSIIGQYSGVDYDTLCRHRCFKVAECQVWTWMTDKTCKLMGINQHSAPQKIPKPEAISGGMPCNMDQMLAPGTLYCWALMQPDGYETGLIADQFAKHLSIFNCEESALLSNKQVEVAPGLFTEVVETELGCAMGGEFGTALNLDIFIKVWDHIVATGTYLNHDWTVKVDPDAVFFADRLRGILPHHPEEAKGVYLNNCRMGMHGPVEVFSRNAVGALTCHWQDCRSHFEQLCGGDCQWGEDMFIDQCLKEVARARRDNDWNLLVEDHCLADGASWSTAMCDGTHVAFHPFKEVASYSECFSIAWTAAAAAVTQQNQEVQAPN